MKPLTEAQLFRRVAQQFERQENYSPFLCDIVWQVTEDHCGYLGAEHDEAREAAHTRIASHCSAPDGSQLFSAYVDEGDDYWEIERNPYREARTLAAYWMALEAEEDARAARRARK